MKTTNLIYFQYTNAATSYMVSATEYELEDDSKTYRVTVINQLINNTLKFERAAQAMQYAEAHIKGMLKDMAPIYLAD